MLRSEQKRTVTNVQVYAILVLESFADLIAAQGQSSYGRRGVAKVRNTFAAWTMMNPEHPRYEEATDKQWAAKPTWQGGIP